MNESTARTLLSRVSGGVLEVYNDKRVAQVVGTFKSAQLIDAGTLYLYSLSKAGELQRRTVTEALVLGSPETLQTAVAGFYTRDLPGVGVSYGYVTGGQLRISVDGRLYSTVWPSERLDEFEFDFSSDLQTISVLYMRPGSPVQAFIEYLEASEVVEPCATPVIAPVSGSYVSSVSVSITCSTPGSTIYYTTDGSTPTTASAVYTSAFELTASTSVKAIATAPGFDQSAMATATYNITIPTTLYTELLRLYDFELGPKDLPSSIASSWNS
jgi:hypothetical protein